MQSFTMDTPRTQADAGNAGRANGAKFLAGGTDLMQLMKNNVIAPRRMVNIEQLNLSTISAGPDGLRLGATATMADVAANASVRQDWPAISQALLASANPMIRNMGTMSGNLLQRTRCNYFRDTGFSCNKRAPGSGCPAIPGDSRDLAILGVSAHCIATQPSDMPVALVALDASVELRNPDGGTRTVKLEDFYRVPGDTPNVETVLEPGELVTAIVVPRSDAARASHYLKVRDRTTFAFALASACVALDVQGGTIRSAGIAAGGVGTKPWRLPSVEAALRGKPVSDATLQAAADRAGDGAQTTAENHFKVDLLRRTVLHTLRTATA